MGSGSELAFELSVADGHDLEARTTARPGDDAKVFPADASAEHGEARSGFSAAQYADALRTTSERADATGNRQESSLAEAEAGSEAAPESWLKAALRSGLKSA